MVLNLLCWAGKCIWRCSYWWVYLRVVMQTAVKYSKVIVN